MQNPNLFQLVFEEATIGMLVVDRHGIIVRANPFARQLFGYSIAELKGQPVEMLLPEALRQIHVRHRSAYVKNPTPRLMGAGLELYGLRKSGAQFPIEISLSHVEIGEEAMVIAYINDDTQRRNMLDDLSEGQSRLSAIINTAVDGIITISDRGVVETINPAAARLFGYAPEEVIGQKVNMLMSEPEQTEHDQYLHNYQHTGEKKIIGIGREVTGRRKDGSTFPFYLGVNEVQLKDRIIYTGILHDLTEQKMAEEQVRRYTRALERSNQELEDFAYVSSHDLQEPLRKIRAFGDRLKSKVEDRLNEKELDYLNRMLNGAARMQTLITDLLEFSRISTHAKPFEPVDLNEVVQRVLSDLEIF
ncbi:MAG: PAS domain S-box protein, partial [Bacteroidota bacterium]